MNNDIEVQVSSNRNLDLTCRTCGVTISAGDYFVRTASEGGPECIECVRCVSDRWKQQCEAREVFHDRSVAEAEAALDAELAGIPYHTDTDDEVKACRESQSELPPSAISLPPSSSVCERYKKEATYGFLMREWEGSKPWDTGADFCDECFQKILYECRKCYRTYPHDPESRPGKRNADGVWVRDERHICEDCHYREQEAKELGVEEDTLLLDDYFGHWVSPKHEPERALHLAIENAKQALRQGGMPPEAIDAKFGTEDAAYAGFLVAEEAKRVLEREAWRAAHPSWGKHE